jgi:hypothetical protein
MKWAVGAMKACSGCVGLWDERMILSD